MEIVAQILDMVQEILSFANEGEAAGIVEIIKNFFANFSLPY